MIMKIKIKYYSFFLVGLMSLSHGKEPLSIGFWNVENLFDLDNDPKKNDDEFDAIHYDADGQRELGKRYFNEFLRLKNQ